MLITIERYLTEGKLADALREIVGDMWVGRQILLPGSRCKWDMAFKQDERLVLVEYDGDDHYRDSLKIKSDLEKDRLAHHRQARVVHMPYWVQLDDTTLQYYFGLSADVRGDFPHGFITTKLFPASFCELGIDRFRDELQALPSQVRVDVIQSLRERIAEHGLDYVLPSSLRYLLET